MKRASPPADSIRSTLSRAPGALMSHTTTRAPRRAKASAEARPIPDPAPVTRATLPSNAPIAGPSLSRFASTLVDHVPFVGAALRRLEDPRLLRGQAQFIEDLELPRQLQVAFVRSEYPHARLVAVDL